MIKRFLKMKSYKGWHDDKLKETRLPCTRRKGKEWRQFAQQQAGWNEENVTFQIQFKIK